MCRVLCKCPGATLTARIKPSAGQRPKHGHSHPAPLWRTTTHPTYLVLLKSQVAVALQNNFPLSSLNFARAQGLINPSAAGSDQDRLVFEMLVNSWGPAHKTHCWRAGLGPWSSLGPSLLETPREPSFLQHPKRPGSYWSMVPSRCLPWHLPTATPEKPRRVTACHCTPQIPIACMFVHSSCTGIALEETKMNHRQTRRQKKAPTGNY